MPRRVDKAAVAKEPDLKVRPSTVEITQIAFDRGPKPEDDGEGIALDIQLGFAAHRVGPLAIRTQLSARTVSEGPQSINVTAETVLNLVVPEGTEIDVDEHLAKMSGQLGPVVMYPYIRELIADITRRAGMEPVTLPIVQVGRIFTVAVDSIRFEPPTEAERDKVTTPKRKQAAKKKNSRKRSDGN